MSTRNYVPKKKQVAKRKAPARPQVSRALVPRSPKSESSMSPIGSALGEMAGGIVPLPGASKIGKFLGGKLGHLIGKITGFGDYTLDQNTVMKGGLSPPQIVNSVETGGFIVRHREFIGDITATTVFTNRPYIIQPGDPNTFPWLSTIAGNFEQYRLRGVLFEFNSTSSDSLLSSATSTALGTVAMQTDYDVADDPPNSKRQMLNSMFASSDKPSNTFIHPIECKKSLSSSSILFTRTSAVPAGYDQRLYDFARFNIATEGMQANGGIVGELWVTYEVEFFKQQYNFVGLADNYYMNAITTLRPLGTVIGSNIGRGGTIGGLISGDGLSYSFPPQASNGQYLVSYVLNGVSSAGVTPATITATANCAVVNLFTQGTASQIACPNPPATSATAIRMIFIRIIAQNASITFSGATGVNPATSVANLTVIRLPDSMVA